jgi:non-homologous end joining protein Ku
VAGTQPLDRLQRRENACVIRHADCALVTLQWDVEVRAQQHATVLDIQLAQRAHDRRFHLQRTLRVLSSWVIVHGPQPH